MTMQCDMEKDCKAPVTHISEKGYIYCKVHSVERRQSGYESTRKMRPWELKRIAAGEPLSSRHIGGTSYSEVLQALERLLSALREGAITEVSLAQQHAEDVARKARGEK